MNYSYRVLNKQIFREGEYSLVPIRSEDRFEIMRWRNEQIFHLRQTKLLTEQDQDNYFNKVITNLFQEEKPDQILFSYLQGEKCIGYGGLVHINWIDKNAEISFIIDTNFEKKDFQKHWSIYLDLLEKVAFEELDFHKIYTYAFDLRPHLYTAIEANGFVKEAILKEHCFFNGEYRDVIIHSKINLKITIRRIHEKDKKITFQWANDYLTRANSFNTDPVNFETHSNWFDKKLNDKKVYYYICEVNNQPAGLVRFDRNEDGELIIGISVDENFRGKKLAYIFLIKCCKTYINLSNECITAIIKKENKASIKSFEKAGFILERRLILNNLECYKYVYNK